MKRKRGVIFKAGPSNLALFFGGMAIASWLVTVVLSGFPLFAWVYYQVVPSTSSRLAEILGQVKVVEVPIEQEKEKQPLPEFDESLPAGHWVKIPRIGVETEMREASYDNYEQVFRKGVWRVPDFASPEDTRNKPVIMAAHRFGYLEWSNQYRRENSFFSLPKLEVGDEVEVIWDQRKYVYRVTRLAEVEEIDDYSPDLILYTCKFLVSPVRIFVYGERVN